MASYGHWFGWGDAGTLLDDLRQRSVNYRPDELDDGSWHHDTHHTELPAERPGPPENEGSWEIARQLVENYEAADPAIIRGVYRADTALCGRDMLLEGRFHGLHFHMGVRVTDVVDESREDGTRVWGWSYQTLEGHLERGRMTYEVLKHTDSGRVEFVTHGMSQRAPTLGPVIGLGWGVFGRRTQLRFYRECGRRMARKVGDIRSGATPMPSPVVVDGLVHAPSDARPQLRDRLAKRQEHPG
jgi:uncharacterized protein (UPF0548 family)